MLKQGHHSERPWEGGQLAGQRHEVLWREEPHKWLNSQGQEGGGSSCSIFIITCCVELQRGLAFALACFRAVPRQLAWCFPSLVTSVVGADATFANRPP